MVSYSDGTAVRVGDEIVGKRALVSPKSSDLADGDILGVVERVAIDATIVRSGKVRRRYSDEEMSKFSLR